jgi:PPOX class probable F420-dependent enzyme
MSAFDGKKYLSLETYRKSGKAVRTPVWFAADTNRIYVYSTADSGKAKRIRLTPSVRIAPCDIRGNVTGPWIDARAEIVGGEEFNVGMRLLDRKYWPWKQLLNLLARHERVVLAIEESAGSTPPAAVADI